MMSESGKFVVCPKVRFCQWEDDNEDQEHEISQKSSFPLRKPTIKNIVTIDKPYKIVSLDDNLNSKTSHREETSPLENLYLNDKKWIENSENGFDHQKNYDFEDISLTRKLPSREYQFNDYQSPSVDSSFSSKEEIPQTPKLVEVDVHAEDISDPQVHLPQPGSDEAQAFLNSKEHLFRGEQSVLLKPNNKPQEKIIDSDFKRSREKKNLSTIQEESLQIEVSPRNKTPEPESLNVPEDLKFVTKQSYEPKSPRKAYKCTSSAKRQLNSINRLSKAKSPKKNVPENSKNLRLPVNSKFRTRPLGFIQKSSTKPKVAGVMPCLKSKVAASGKTSPVKKTVLRNVTVKPTKVFVGPGISRPQKELKVDFDDERKQHFQAFNSDKLSKPEYNSIMSTINKLKEVQKENIITDVDHLPPIYKSLVNGKVTNSLDFLPDEAIFKNLINLSIDETQLPTRFTRSKDPEPRQRDAVPKLSDFFVPKYANEYCTAVFAKPRSPEPLETWNAFRISDKIRSWKWNMDFVH